MKKRKMFLLLMVMLVVSFSVSAFAEMGAGSLSMSHMGGRYLFEGNQDYENGFMYTAALGYLLSDHVGAELVFNFVDTEKVCTGEDDEGYFFHGDGLYYFTPEKRFVPYLAAGFGSTSIRYRGRDVNPFFNYGAGALLFLSDRIALRGDVRHVFLFYEEGFNNLSATLGLTFLLDKGRAEAASPMPKDSDGDGVIDSIDQCPGTPPGTPVDSIGCPEKPAEGVTPVEPRDRVVEQPDEKPITVKPEPDKPVGVKPDEPVVVKPDEPVVVKPDEVRDIPSEKVLMELVIEFEFDEAGVDSVYLDRIREAADMMKSNPDIKATIEGHTCNIGTDKYNKKLSKRRAENVRQEFVNLGVDTSRFELEALGETKPAHDNSTEEGRKRNRRAVTILLKTR